jgi:RNA polymerase sigma-70 factor (ECF subfamily)
MDDPESVNLAAVERGEDPAVHRFIDLYRARVYAFVRRLSGSDSDAVELTQRTFCRVWTALPTFAGRSSITSWIHGIAYRTYVDWLRTERRNQAMPDEWWRQIPDQSSGPDVVSGAADDASMVYRAVDRLEPDLRTTVHLHYYQGLSIEETAIALEIATSTVKHRVRRALESIRQAVTKPLASPNHP